VANPTVVAPALGLAVAGRAYGSTAIALTLTIDNNYINGTHPITDDLGAVEREFGHALGVKSTGRTANGAGLIAQYAALRNGATLAQLGDNFVASAEFTKRYGTAPTDKVLVNAYYENTLHRLPDAAGEAQYLGALSSGGFSRADLLVAFANSQEHINALAQRTAARDAGGFNLDLSPHLGLIPVISAPMTA